MKARIVDQRLECGPCGEPMSRVRAVLANGDRVELTITRSGAEPPPLRVPNVLTALRRALRPQPESST